MPLPTRQDTSVHGVEGMLQLHGSLSIGHAALDHCLARLGYDPIVAQLFGLADRGRLFGV